MSRPPELGAFYDGWFEHQQKLLESIRPLTPEQMLLRPAPGEWAIWQLASNMAGGRLYWLCSMLGEDDRGIWSRFRAEGDAASGERVPWAGWEDDPEHPRTADELVEVFDATWGVVEGCLDRWSLDDLVVEVTQTDARGQVRTITRGWVLWRLMSHEVHHTSEITTILRLHGLPFSLNL